MATIGEIGAAFGSVSDKVADSMVAKAEQIGAGTITPSQTIELQTSAVEYGVTQTGLSGSIDKVGKGMDSTVNKV